MMHYTPFFHRLLRPVAAAVLAGFFAANVAAGTPVTMTLHHADGTTTSVQLYTRPQVTFAGDQVVIKSPVATMTYAAADVLRITYGGDIPVRVDDPRAEQPYTEQDGALVFDANVKAADVQLFAEDGKRLPVSVRTANGRPSLSLASLPAGVYVLSVNGRTSKFVKK